MDKACNSLMDGSLTLFGYTILMKRVRRELQVESNLSVELKEFTFRKVIYSI